MRGFIGALALVAALVVAAPAQATPCWGQIVNDWYEDGRIEATYSADCYRDAIANLPTNDPGGRLEPLRRALTAAQARERAAAERPPDMGNDDSAMYPLLVILVAAGVVIVSMVWYVIRRRR